MMRLKNNLKSSQAPLAMLTFIAIAEKEHQKTFEDSLIELFKLLNGELRQVPLCETISTKAWYAAFQSVRLAVPKLGMGIVGTLLAPDISSTATAKNKYEG